MELTKFVNDFASEFVETPQTVFNGETNYKELTEWDSVLALSIISMIDDNYNKRISGAELRSCQTIQELYNIICNI
jgi:acyl carrier protein